MVLCDRGVGGRIRAVELQGEHRQLALNVLRGKAKSAATQPWRSSHHCASNEEVRHEPMTTLFGAMNGVFTRLEYEGTTSPSLLVTHM